MPIPLFPASALAVPRLVFRALNAATALVLVLNPLAFACALAASRRRRRALLQMAIGGTLAVLAVTIALARLLSTLSTRAAPRYQAVANVVVHTLTNSFFAMTTWFVPGASRWRPSPCCVRLLPLVHHGPDRPQDHEVAPAARPHRPS